VCMLACPCVLHYMHACMRACLCLYAKYYCCWRHANLYIYIYIYIYIYMRTYIYIYAYIYIYMRCIHSLKCRRVCIFMRARLRCIYRYIYIYIYICINAIYFYTSHKCDVFLHTFVIHQYE